MWSGRWIGAIASLLMLVLLAAVALPAIQQARESARRTQSKNNLKQLGLALHNYASTYDILPPGGVFNAEGRAFHGWTTFIAPYIEASPFYNGVNINIPWDHPDQLKYFQRYPGDAYLNPSIGSGRLDDGLKRNHYSGSDLVFYRNSSTSFSDLTNGTAHTLLVGDAKGMFQPFGYPYEWRSVALGLNTTEEGFGSPVREITQMLLADGSVREFSHHSDQDLFLKLRGVNAKWDHSAPDVSKPAGVYHLSEPLVSLWSDPKRSDCIIGVQNESRHIVRAWIHDSETSWNSSVATTLDGPAQVLKKYQSLRVLDLGYSLTDRGLRLIEGLPDLEEIKVGGRATTNRGLEILSRCRRLKHLEIGAARFGDHSWSLLAKLPKLESVIIGEPAGDTYSFSTKSVVAFLDERPDCRVQVGQGLSPQKIRDLAKSGEPWPPYRYGK
ncbi:DUF1559 domain-containing protein [Schlesneria sp. DSM 10557]|uniref:DUF1559 family PulG-like putative transporter n=1 Tax=Schlesneria sp. DSM 10557 TaxID=3044399 RepID=UPI0035A0B275